MPTFLNTRILRGLHKPNFEIQVLPRAAHSLLETGTGVVDDDDKATHLAHDVFLLIAAWLGAHVGTAATP